MDQICRVTTVKKLRKTLESLPLNYEEAYKDTLDRILRQDRERDELARHAMHWVCASRRPLDMAELQHAIASLDDDDPGYGQEDLATEKSIISSCLGILVHSKTSGTIQLVHSSARDVILGQLGLDDHVSQTTISRACMRYMSSVEMAKGPSNSLQDLKTRLTEMPFLEYATRHYGHHVRPVQEELLGHLVAFLNDDNFRQSSWQLLHFVFNIDSQSAQALVGSIPKNASVLHVACYWGFSSLLQHLLNECPTHHVLDLADSHGWTGLHWAASAGHTEMVGSLLDAGADIDSLDHGDWTPLFWGVVRGHMPVVNLLLERGADLFHADANGFTPLHWSVLSGREEITALLLEQGKKASRRLLHSDGEQSVKAGSLTIEQAKALQVPKKFKNLFELTSQTSNIDGFEQLAASFDQHGWKGYNEAGLDVKHFEKAWDRTKEVLSKGEGRLRPMHNEQNMSPIDAIRCRLLTSAIQNEDAEMVKSIFQLSVDMNKDLSSDVVTSKGATYMHVAAYSGSADIMQILISRGLPLNATDKRGMTPLHYACRTGTSQIVEMILRAGADVDAKLKRTEWTPLMVLLRFGAWRTCNSPGETLTILRALVASGASVHARNAGGNGVLDHAIFSYDPAVIQALLDLGADPGAMDVKLATLIHVLARGCVVTDHFYILDPGIEGFNERFYEADVPCHLKEAVVRLLLQVSPPHSLTSATKDGSSALALAIHSRNWMLAHTLFQTGAPFLFNLEPSKDPKTNLPNNPIDELSKDLVVVSEQGFYELAPILLHHGAKLKEDDIISSICLQVPAEKQHQWTNGLCRFNDTPEWFPLRDHALVVRQLVAAGANVDQESSAPKPYWKMTAIQIVAERGVDVSILAALLDCGADPFAETKEGLDSFLLALVCGKEDNLILLLSHAATEDNLARDHWLTNWLRKPDANWSSTLATYMSAIHDATLFDAWDMNGHPLLFHAVGRGNQALVSELLKLGADPNLADPFGWTPFHEAVRTENTVLAKQLISHGADAHASVSEINAYSASTSSHGMFYQDDGAAVINSLHIAAGVNPHSLDLDARKRLSPEMVRLLLELGLDPNSKTKNTAGLGRWDLRQDETPLQIMFRDFRYGDWGRKFFEVVQSLVDAGADVTGIADGLGPRHVARFEGYEDLWEVFRAGGAAVEAVEGVLPS